MILVSNYVLKAMFNVKTVSLNAMAQDNWGASFYKKNSQQHIGIVGYLCLYSADSSKKDRFWSNIRF